jgi:hypothetical protein
VTGRDKADYRLRIGAAAARRDTEPGELVDRWRQQGIPCGPPDQIAETMTDLERVGVSRYYLQWIDLDDIDGLRTTWDALRS